LHDIYLGKCHGTASWHCFRFNQDLLLLPIVIFKFFQHFAGAVWQMIKKEALHLSEVINEKSSIRLNNLMTSKVRLR